MAEVPDNVDEAIEELSDTPTTDEVFFKTLPFQGREIASAAVSMAAAGGGGSSSAVGATVRASGTVFVDAGDLVPFDTEVWDSGGFIETDGLVVPSGQDGVYIYGFVLKTGGLTPAADAYFDGACVPSGFAPNLYAIQYAPTATFEGFVICGVMSVARFAAGDALSVELSFKNGSDTSLALEGDDCALFLAQVGT